MGQVHRSLPALSWRRSRQKFANVSPKRSGKCSKNQQRRISKRPLDLTHIGAIYVSFKAQAFLGQRALCPERFNIDPEMPS
jgi:hypothetical protein